MKDHFKQFVTKTEQPRFSEEAQSRMKHGSTNEINAMATLVGKVLPCFAPDIIIREVGCYTTQHDSNLYMVISPDGEGLHGDQRLLTVELKCPCVSKPYCSPVHYDVPAHYIPQLLSQMNTSATDGEVVHECIYLSWTEESSTVFTIRNDEKLWQEMYTLLQQLYGGDKPLIPKKKPCSVPLLKEAIDSFRKNNITFWGEFSSVKAIPCKITRDEVSSTADLQTVYHSHTAERSHAQSESKKLKVIDIEQVLQNVSDSISNASLLTKPRATNVIVYMLSDLDRTKHDEKKLLTIPVYYGLAGKSVPVATLRGLTQDVLCSVQQRGLHVACKGFDGQMYKLAVEDDNERSLTLLQEQKKLWLEENKNQKSDLAASIVEQMAIVSSQNSQTSAQNISSGVAIELLPQYSDMSESAKTGLEELNSALIASLRSLVNIFQLSKPEEDQLWAVTVMRLREQVRGRNEISDETPENEAVDNTRNAVFEELDIASDKELEQYIQSLESEISALHRVGHNEDSDNVTDPDNDAMEKLFAAEHSESEVAPTPTEVQHSTCQLMEAQENIYAAGLDGNELMRILRTLQTASEKMQTKWAGQTTENLSVKFQNAITINQSFTLDELKEIYKVVKDWFTGKPRPHYKADYVNLFSSLLGDHTKLAVKERKSKKISPNLKSVLTTKMSKKALVVIICVLKWPERIKQWKRDGMISDTCKVANLNQPQQWYSQPEILDNGEAVYSFLDFHHLFTNTRCHIARKGYVAANINRDAWMKVAKKEKDNKSGLNIAFVEDVIDPQSNTVAKTFFSEAVEKEMRKNGDVTEANFCQIMREWYSALDTRGIPSMQRVQMLLNMHQWLLQWLQPALVQFPPPGGFVQSIPRQNFEGLLISVERFMQLYTSVKGQCFNARALGSQMNETFFSSFRDLDPRGAGVLKPGELPRAMSVACQLLEARLDPHR